MGHRCCVHMHTAVIEQVRRASARGCRALAWCFLFPDDQASAVSSGSTVSESSVSFLRLRRLLGFRSRPQKRRPQLLHSKVLLQRFGRRVAVVQSNSVLRILSVRQSCDSRCSCTADFIPWASPVVVRASALTATVVSKRSEKCRLAPCAVRCSQQKQGVRRASLACRSGKHLAGTFCFASVLSKVCRPCR